MITVWLGIGAAIALALWWQSQDRLAASLVLGGLGVLALMVLLPHAVRQPLQNLLDGAFGDRSSQLVGPLLHVLGFAVLACASRLAQPRRALWHFVAVWLLAAVLLELAEIFFSQFDADDLADMAWNAAGVALGLTVAGMILRRRRDRAEARSRLAVAG